MCCSPRTDLQRWSRGRKQERYVYMYVCMLYVCMYVCMYVCIMYYVSQNFRTTGLSLKTVIRVCIQVVELSLRSSRQSSYYTKLHHMQRFGPIWTFFRQFLQHSIHQMYEDCLELRKLSSTTCIHMYVSMYVCMYVSMYVCIYVCMYVCMYACM